MITFPSLKDRAWGSKHPDMITCQMLVMAEFEWFKKYQHEESGKRCEEYQKLKKIWEEKCLNILYKYYPKIKDYIEVVDISTPLSIQYYLNEPNGGACGLDITPHRFVDNKLIELLDIKTKINGLYLTDTLICGQPVVQMSGLVTAIRVLGLSGTTIFLLDAIRAGLQYLLFT